MGSSHIFIDQQGKEAAQLTYGELYRKAMAFLKLNNKEAAKSALRQLIADYPKSEDSQRAKAKLAFLK